MLTGTVAHSVGSAGMGGGSRVGDPLVITVMPLPTAMAAIGAFGTGGLGIWTTFRM